MEPNVKTRKSAKKTVRQDLPMYERARIPQLFPCKMEKEVIKLHLDMKKLMKLNIEQRKAHFSMIKVLNFKENLERTMKFWPSNVLSKIGSIEDKTFMESMMTDRILTVSPSSLFLLNKIEEKREARGRKQERKGIVKMVRE